MEFGLAVAVKSAMMCHNVCQRQIGKLCASKPATTAPATPARTHTPQAKRNRAPGAKCLDAGLTVRGVEVDPDSGAVRVLVESGKDEPKETSPLEQWRAKRVVRANIKGVFPTYKTLKDGTRRTYWYHRETGERLRGEPGSPEFIADLAAAEKLIRDRLAGTFNNLVRMFTLSTEFDTTLGRQHQDRISAHAHEGRGRIRRHADCSAR